MCWRCSRRCSTWRSSGGYGRMAPTRAGMSIGTRKSSGSDFKRGGAGAPGGGVGRSRKLRPRAARRGGGDSPARTDWLPAWGNPRAALGGRRFCRWRLAHSRRQGRGPGSDDRRAGTGLARRAAAHERMGCVQHVTGQTSPHVYDRGLVGPATPSCWCRGRTAT